MRLYVTICAHYDESKLVYLKRVLDGIQNIKTEYTKIVISVNDVTEDQYNNVKNLNDQLDITINPVRRLYHPLFLAWNHKHYMLDFMDSDYDYFVYIEDDIEITQTTMDYWIEYRNLFKRNNLNFIPGLLLIEYDNRNNIYAVSPIRSVNISSRPTLTVENKKFIDPEAPHQASIIMDKELVKEHIFSPFFRYETCIPYYGIWLVQDLAAQGNIFHNVPQGFEHRHLLPLDDFSRCWVHHVPNKYVNLPDNRHGKVPVEYLFV